ncbi:MAG: glycosyltransferase [Planctomycetota bacterium]
MTTTIADPQSELDDRLPHDPAARALSEQRRRYRDAHVARWEKLADELDAHGRRLGGYYHDRLARVYGLHVGQGRRVLELGCARGDLLAALEPSFGVGVDFSARMVALGRAKHPGLTFVKADAHDPDAVAAALGDATDEPFDFILLSDLINELHDVQAVLEGLRRFCHAGTRLIVNTYSRLWEQPLGLAAKLNLARPMLRQNWLATSDVSNLLELAGYEPLRSFQEVLWPVRLPGVDALCNRWLVKLPGFRQLALSNFVIARPRGGELYPRNQPEQEPTVSVVVAARNEAGNIDSILDRTPQDLGGGTELVFVEGGSSDGTYEKIEAAIAERPGWGAQIKLYQQDGKGKGDAVRKGFAHASGGVLMILDADMTVPPEDLPRFYEALRSGTGEYINGVRLVYPMEDEAMRFLNLLGNKFFSLAFSWLLGQPIKDTLCGTKVMTAENYRRLAENRSYFGDFDPFGDFDLIFGAAKMNLKMMDLPIRYQARTYGETNISRFRNGAMLLRMTAYAAQRLKFV